MLSTRDCELKPAWAACTVQCHCSTFCLTQQFPVDSRFHPRLRYSGSNRPASKPQALQHGWWKAETAAVKGQLATAEPNQSLVHQPALAC